MFDFSFLASVLGAVLGVDLKAEGGGFERN